jgi:hypothetical protein
VAHEFSDAGAVAGTVHLRQNGDLRLAASVNIPLKAHEVVAWAPAGKGIAGLPLERGQPVQTSNLKEDRSVCWTRAPLRRPGDARSSPGPKAVDVKAAVAIPVRDESDSFRTSAKVRYVKSRLTGRNFD